MYNLCINVGTYLLYLIKYLNMYNVKCIINHTFLYELLIIYYNIENRRDVSTSIKPNLLINGAQLDQYQNKF